MESVTKNCSVICILRYVWWEFQLARTCLDASKFSANSFSYEYEIVQELERRLTSIFLVDKNGHRPVYGGSAKFQNDPHWKDLILFYEYFHGDNGAGIVASQQTGWTDCIARKESEVFLIPTD